MRLVRRPRFVEDTADAFGWIAQHDRHAADRLLDEIEALVGLLSEHPELGRERSEIAPGIRSFRLRGFQYVLFYRLAQDRLVLLRLIHGRRPIRPKDVG